MDLIEKVRELKELASKDALGAFSTEAPEMRYMVEVLNAAPGMLAVLGGFQAGDANILYWMLTGVGDDPSQDDVAGLLSRYHDMAQAMEANHESL